MPRDDKNVIMEDVRLIFRNFTGAEGMYNAEGDRNFSVLLDEDVAQAMNADGWAVKWLKGREEGDADQAYLQVSVKYRARGGAAVRPPKIYMVTSRGRTPLGENEIEILDWADIRTVDMIVRPFEWDVNGKTGIKAYLQSMYVTIVEDPLELKYNSLDDVPSRSGRVDEG